MAKVTGYRCDVCEKVEQSDSNELPNGWMKIHIITVNHHNGSKDICGNKCLLKFAKDRVDADKPVKADKDEEFSPDQKVFIKSHLNALGITGKAMGVRFASHSRYGHGESIHTLKHDCPVCQAITDPAFKAV